MQVEGNKLKLDKTLWVQFEGVDSAEEGDLMVYTGRSEDSYVKVFNQFGRLLKLYTFGGGKWIDTETNAEPASLDESQAGRLTGQAAAATAKPKLPARKSAAARPRAAARRPKKKAAPKRKAAAKRKITAQRKPTAKRKAAPKRKGRSAALRAGGKRTTARRTAAKRSPAKRGASKRGAGKRGAGKRKAAGKARGKKRSARRR